MLNQRIVKYRVVRFYKDHDIRRRILKRNLSIWEAQSHCQNPETSSSTALGSTPRRRTRKLGEWFDGYEEER